VLVEVDRVKAHPSDLAASRRRAPEHLEVPLQHPRAVGVRAGCMLTAKNITSLPAPKRGQKDYPDEGLPGFCLRVSAYGRRVYTLYYRPVTA
jgi:hypothetical protein